MTSSARPRVLPISVGPPARATPLELFFDLVFVFAFTQVTGLMTADPTWAGIGHAVLVLAVLWWTWAGYARLTNRVDPEAGVVRILMLAAMGSLVVRKTSAGVRLIERNNLSGEGGGLPGR